MIFHILHLFTDVQQYNFYHCILVNIVNRKMSVYDLRMHVVHNLTTFDNELGQNAIRNMQGKML